MNILNYGVGIIKEIKKDFEKLWQGLRNISKEIKEDIKENVQKIGRRNALKIFFYSFVFFFIFPTYNRWLDETAKKLNYFNIRTFMVFGMYFGFLLTIAFVAIFAIFRLYLLPFIIIISTNLISYICEKIKKVKIN